ncbi:MAG: BBE domain-containing protein [Candidatus Rokubacteria bacterium]|nr:BBE domain-containing protein [Candidatus Rokubacteria bacterium]
MAKLEDLTRGATVKGILPDGPVTVIDAQWHGSTCVELTYKDAAGRPHTEFLFRDREPALEIVAPGRTWSFEADGALLRLVSEAYRIRLAHLFDPLLAVHTSILEPLPHQITAVYGEMLPRQPLSDDAIDTMIECFAGCPTPMGQLLLEHFHGAVTRVGVSATAFPHRADGYNLLVLSEWMEPANTDRCIAWARKTYAETKPFVASGRYVNYLGDDETGDPSVAAYGPNCRRLQELKTKYDPTNFFHMNQNIRPLS